MFEKQDLINGGEGYANFAHFRIYNDKIFDFNILKQDAIILCKTDYIDFLFNNIKFSSKKYILITHFSDYYIDATKFSKRPSCIKKWYASVTAYDHPDLIQIPIGFGIHWIEWPKPNETFKQWFYDNYERLSKIEKNTCTVHCNFTIDQHRPPRHQVMNKMQANGVLCYMPENNNTINGRQLFPDYCEDMAKHQFVASPPGNGIDCHRNWEAIYMGCIPIVIKNYVYKQYTELPIIQVNDYSEVTNEMLQKYLEYYHTYNFNYEKAKLTYWEKRIKQDLDEWTNK